MGDTDRFEHFVITRRADGSLWELGRGAMGVTYKAFDTNLRADVALKVINSHYLNSETARQRFLREARAAASLRHPNVATVFHLGNSEGAFYYAMEYVEGETVERRVQREGPLPSDLALRVTRQVSRALIAADRQKLVHRDIKPSNIMLVVDEDEDHLLVKVIDFGLAKSLIAAVDQSLTVSMGGFVGTPHFASPEQLEEKEIDIRSDIYSLGATLWFMLAGRPPFQGSMASVINQHLNQQLPSDILVKLHPRIAALLEKMLAKHPEDRFQSPSDLKRELDDILSDLKGQSPTLAPMKPPTATSHPAGATTVGGTSTSGFATGQLIRNRYQIIGQSPLDKNLFKAKDLHSNRIVALRPIPLTIRYEATRLDFLRQEIERLRTIHHPNLLEVLGLEAYDRGLFIVSEWIKGFSLQDLLRARRELAWDETLRITKPLAKVLDFVADRKLLAGGVSLRKIFVEIPHLTEEAVETQRTPVSSWPPFIVKADALSLGRTLPEFLAEPTQTIADAGGFDLPANHIQQLALVIHELLGGVKPTSSTGSAAPKLNPVPNLSEPGNAILRLGATEPGRFTTAGDFLAELEAAEVNNQPSVTPPMAIPQLAGSEHAALPRSIPATPPMGELIEDSQPKTSPVLLRMLLTGIGLFLVCAIGAVIGANFLTRKTEPPPVVSQMGSVAVTSKPEGALVRWNSQEIGKTPLDSYPLPKGKYILELSLAGYQTRPIEVEINQGSLNNLGLVPLVHDVGQLSIKSAPGNLAFEIVDSERKTTFGNTPMTVDNLPTGKYTVRIKRSGWSDFDQEIDLKPNALVAVEHTFKGVSVTLKSDPAGATIFMGDTELGKTPLTVDLPPEPVELVSRIGALAPVKREIVPDPNGTSIVEFKHEYGLISLASDRADSEVIIGGIKLGKLPIEGILPPGQHQVVIRAPGVPDQARIVDVKVGQRSVMQVNFNTVGGAAATLSPSQTESKQSASQATPGQNRPRTPRPAEKPVYRTKEDYDRAKDAAYDRFDAEWEARKNALKREKDYYDNQADHSEGASKEKWKMKKDEVDRRLDQLDDQKDAAKNALKRQWND
jgi:serine/threonine protein kinase